MKLYKVGILGATGAVGREMMKILAERQFPISELRLFASSRSAGKVVEWNGRPVMIQEPSEENFRGLDIVLGAAESDIARLYAPEVVRAARCLWTTRPPTAWTTMCRSSSRRSTRRM